MLNQPLLEKLSQLRLSAFRTALSTTPTGSVYQEILCEKSILP
jgi:hypothetical protein